jgi:hypothetical protein
MTHDSRSSMSPVMTQKRSSFAVTRPALRLLTAITAMGLAVDAYVHWNLAPSFDTVVGTGSLHISQGGLFRLEAVLALLAGVLILSTRRRVAAGFGLLVAAGGLGALLLYGYVNVGDLGPFPDMYDPIWYTEKTISAVAEAVAALGALGLLLLPRE